jgi:ribonuclease E
VLRRLVECLGRDRTKHQVAEVTSLGLVQMTRKRIGTGLLESFSETCEACNGRGVHIRIDPVDADDHSADGENGGRRSRRRRRGGGGGAATVDGREADRTSAEPEAQPDTTGTSAAEPVADAADAQPAVNAPAVEAQPAEATVVSDVAPTADAVPAAVPDAEAPAHTGDHAQLVAEAEPQPAAEARADETEAQPAASTEDSAPESDEATAEESDEARAAASDAAKAPEPDAAKAEEPVEVGADPSAGVVVEIRSSAQVDHDAAEVVPAPAPSADPTAEPHDAQSQADQSQADQREADQGEGDQGEGDQGPHEAEETVLASATAPVDPTVEALNGEAVPAAPETANPDEPTPANLDEPTVPTQHLDESGAPEQGDASQRGEGDGGEHGGEAVDRPDDQDETPEGDDTVRSEQTTQDGEQETEPETRQNQGSTAGPTSWW